MTDRELKLQLVRRVVTDALRGLELLFERDMELTFIARHPTDPTVCVVVTRSSVEDLRAVLDHVRPAPDPRPRGEA
jgi:hypothetical protein